MRSDQPSKPEPYYKALLPVRGRWARYLLCLTLVISVYLALTARIWLGVVGIRLPVPATGVANWIAMSLAFRSWGIMANTRPIEAHRRGGRVGAVGAGAVAASAAFILTPASLRGVAALFAAIAFIMALPVGVLAGGAAWGSRAAAHERETSLSSSDLFD